MNYTELTTAIEDYTENTFSAAQLATFVQNAEERIYNSVQLPDLRKNEYANLTIGQQYLECPPDFLSPFSMAIKDATGAYSFLLNKDVNFLREAYPDPTVTGQPKYYCIFGPQSANLSRLTFMVAPTPDAAYYTELHYFYYPESIVTAGNTWLGDEFESALLYGSLLEAYAFMKGEDSVMATYNQRYNEAMALLKNLGDGKDRMDAYRSGQVRNRVM